MARTRGREGRRAAGANESRQPAQPRGWRRWVRIGPATTIALIVAAVLLAVQVAQLRRQVAQQGPRGGPPAIQREVAHSQHPGTYPPVQFLIDRSARLHLAPNQVSRLEQIQKQWSDSTAPLRRSLSEETDKYQAFLKEAEKNGHVSLQEIQRRAEPVSALSGDLAESRYQAWQKALAVLSQSQRAQAEQMRKTETAPGLERAPANKGR